MKLLTKSIILVVICTFFTSLAQVMYKMSVPQLSLSIDGILLNHFLLLGLLLYAAGAVILIISLRGGDVSLLYPIVATSYIWVSLMSSYFFGESMNLLKWMGVALIIFGIIAINLKAGKEDLTAYVEPV